MEVIQFIDPFACGARIFQNKTIAFHQNGLEKQIWFDFERSRTAATRSITYKGSNKNQNVVFEENDVKNFDQNFVEV